MNPYVKYLVALLAIVILTGCGSRQIDYDNPTKRDLGRLMKELKDPTHENHELAMQALAKLGPDAVKPLLKTMSAKSMLVRRDTATVLGEIGPEASAAIPLLIAAFDDDPPVAGAASVALGKIGKQSVPELIKKLRDSNDMHRILAARAFRYIGPDGIEAADTLVDLLWDTSMQPDLARALGSMGAEVVPLLITTLKDFDPDMRVGAAKALGNIGPDAARAEPGLIKALSDKEPSVRCAAALALGEISPDSNNAAIELVKLFSDKNYQVSFNAGSAMAMFGDVAVPHLKKALSSSNKDVRYEALTTLVLIRADITPAKSMIIKCLSDPYFEVRKWAAWAVRDLGPSAREAAPALRRLLRDSNPEVRAHAADALGGIEARDENTLNLLFGLFDDEYEDVRSSAADSVAGFGAGVVPRLIDRLHSSDDYIRSTAAFALERMGEDGSQAVPALLEMLAGEDEGGRASALLALKNMFDEHPPEVVKGIIGALNDKDSGIRMIAAQALGSVKLEGVKAAVPGLIANLEDADWGIKLAVIESLGNLGPSASEALPRLRELLTETTDRYHITKINEAIAKIEGKSTDE